MCPESPITSHESPLWPELPLDGWRDTYDTLHLWSQVVGKVRMEQCAPINHWWHVTLAVTSRGLTTGPMPAGAVTFQIDFDFVSQELSILTSSGAREGFCLAPMTVAEFYRRTMAALQSARVPVTITTLPQEIPNAIPFDEDTKHASYDGDAARRFWHILLNVDRILREFRSSFLGKVSPVQFWWGSFDLAMTLFSGRPAPPHPAGGGLSARVTREAYSHEEYSCGWWPGGGAIDYPAFYAYTYPEPAGFKDTALQPAAAFYAKDMGECILPYDAVRLSDSPEETLLQFLRSTYSAAADLAHWDRAALERAD